MSQLVVPKGWESQSLGKITINFDSKRIPLNKTERSKIKGQYPYYGATGKVDSINDYKFDGRFLLVTEDASLGNPGFRKNPIAYIVEGKFWVNNHAHVLQTNSELNLDFLCYYLNSIKIMDYAKNQSTRPKLNKSTLEKIPIFFPSDKSIQKQIVAKLDNILGQLEEKKKQILTIIENNKQRIDFFEKNWLSYVIDREIEHHPDRKNWELKKLGDDDISEIIMGQSPPSSTYNKEQDGLPFFQGRRDFGENFPIPSVWCNKPTRIAEKDDILLSVRAPVGSTNWAIEKCCIGRGLSAIRVKIVPEYVYYFLKSLEKKLSKSGTGSVFNSIRRDFIHNLLIPVPSSEIQKQIIQSIKSAEEKFQSQKQQFQNIKDSYESTIKYIEHMQSSILDVAFSGKLVQ